MRLLMEGTSSVTGDAFFRSLVQHLACALQVKYAFVAECYEDNKTRVRTLAFWDVDHFGDNVEYDLTGTPCENVVHGEVCYYPKRVQKAFPKDHDLKALDAESYLGIPIFSASGEVVGHLAVLDSKPMPDEPEELSFLQIFAVRAGAELQRKRAEEARRESEERFRHLFESSPLAIFVHDAEGNL
ncbi:MAG: GAF domain-containing protein, partial [Calditrichaeota bacterium]